MTIEETAERLSFMGNVEAQYKAAIALQGADCLEAAIIHLKAAWQRREQKLTTSLKIGKQLPGKKNVVDVGSEPKPHPTTKAEFNGLRYEEKLWLYHNSRSEYNKYMQGDGYGR